MARSMIDDPMEPAIDAALEACPQHPKAENVKLLDRDVLGRMLRAGIEAYLNHLRSEL